MDRLLRHSIPSIRKAREKVSITHEELLDLIEEGTLILCLYLKTPISGLNKTDVVANGLTGFNSSGTSVLRNRSN
jgi:hypothetical protein